MHSDEAGRLPGGPGAPPEAEPMPEPSVQALEELPPDAAIAADHRTPRRRNRQRQREEEPEVGTLVHPESHHQLAGLILHRGVKRQILDGLRAIRIRDQLGEIWSISRIQPQQGRCILNFYGPPGTGKTRAALGVALKLGQPLYQVDYSAVISKYLADTAKYMLSGIACRANFHLDGAALGVGGVCREDLPAFLQLVRRTRRYGGFEPKGDPNRAHEQKQETGRTGAIWLSVVGGASRH